MPPLPSSSESEASSRSVARRRRRRRALPPLPRRPSPPLLALVAGVVVLDAAGGVAVDAAPAGGVPADPRSTRRVSAPSIVNPRGRRVAAAPARRSNCARSVCTRMSGLPAAPPLPPPLPLPASGAKPARLGLECARGAAKSTCDASAGGGVTTSLTAAAAASVSGAPLPAGGARRDTGGADVLRLSSWMRTTEPAAMAVPSRRITLAPGTRYSGWCANRSSTRTEAW